MFVLAAIFTPEQTAASLAHGLEKWRLLRSEAGQISRVFKGKKP
jgi:hypothetical protein